MKTLITFLAFFLLLSCKENSTSATQDYEYSFTVYYSGNCGKLTVTCNGSSVTVESGKSGTLKARDGYNSYTYRYANYSKTEAGTFTLNSVNKKFSKSFSCN